ncbi:MAG TPA: DGQHR domain-containing protein [Brevundimonas sp.]|jgi:DGQHR domain-containing protein
MSSIILPETETQGQSPDLLPPDPDKQVLLIPALKVSQPIGESFIASIPFKTLIRMSRFDVRRIMQVERPFETYLGIQRPVDPKRREQLQAYVNFKDANFPGAVIIAIDTDYAKFDEEHKTLEVRNWRDGEENPSVNLGDVARVIDGQHRIAGLENYRGEQFDIPVTIFVGADLSDQAYIFSTVNLEQTKVNKSLSYDLFALAKTRSPQKTAHNIAVALDRDPNSPFYQKIKRLGFAQRTGGTETLTQATFVEMLMSTISTNPKVDRDLLLKGKALDRVRSDRPGQLVFRNLFIDEKDLVIAENVNNYFLAVSERWSTAWWAAGTGIILGRTNGFRALMRFLPMAYRYSLTSGEVVSKNAFALLFEKIRVDDIYFNSERFSPGSGGESSLLQFIKDQLPFVD